MYNQKVWGKLKDFVKLPTKSSIRSVSWESTYNNFIKDGYIVF
jgi:hypothetical protein